MDIPDLLGWEWLAAQEVCETLGLTVNAVPTQDQRYKTIVSPLPPDAYDNQMSGPPWRVIRQRLIAEKQIELVICAEKWQLGPPDSTI